MIKTKNIKLCAYLKLKGINPVKVVKISQGRAEYQYELTEQEFHQHQIDFNSSEFVEYANNLEAIKDLAY